MWVVRQMAKLYFTYFPVDKGKWSAWRKFVHTKAYRSFKKGECKTSLKTENWCDTLKNQAGFFCIHIIGKAGDCGSKIGAGWIML